ncbi:MAG: TolC family protein [Flavobacteriaceae bacterium]|nr:TolC family protein [Flavobacteriaceae bacterium]
MKKSLIILLFLAANLSLAQQVNQKAFTLEEALKFAYENNTQMINADRDVQAAYAQKWATIASGLPQINAAGAYQDQIKLPVSLLPAEIFGGEAGTYIPVTFGQKMNMSASATLNQKIFDGSYIVGVQAIKTYIDISGNALKKTRQEVKKAVVSAYGNVLLLNESATIVAKNISNLKENVEEAKQLFKQGFVEEEQLEQLQITLSNLESQERNVKRLQSISKQLFNLLLGLPLNNQTELLDDLESLAAKNLLAAKDPIDFEIFSNIDYQIAVNMKEQKRLELKLERSKYLPTLNAFVNYSTNAFGNEFNFFSSEQNWFDASVFGLNLNVPIFSSFMKRAYTKKAKIAFDQSQSNLKEAEKKIQLQFEQSKSQFQLAAENYKTSKENLSLAQRIENKNSIKYKEGLISGFDLRQAQLQLYEAQRSYLESMLAVINSKTELETLTEK